MRYPGIMGSSGAGVGEVEDRFMIDGGGVGFVGGVEGLVRGLLMDAGEESGEEDGRMGSFVATETVGEEAVILGGMLGTRNMFGRLSWWMQGSKGG